MMGKECKEIVEIAEGPSICVQEQPSGKTPSAVLEESAYGIKISIHNAFEETLASVRRALDQQGFEIISELDLRGLFSDKLNAYISDYKILSSIHPQLARQAFDLDRDIGLLVSSDVIVYEHDGKTLVAAVDPIAKLSIAGSDGLTDIARTIKQHLQDAIDHVAAGLV
jgi:uncharacterized protein (DUF302 family)